MKIKGFLFAFAVAGYPWAVQGQVVDRVLLGLAESEKVHGLTVYCPENVKAVEEGFLGESGRSCLRFENNPFAGKYPGIYGGEYSFVLKVDGTKQNYLTLRTYGGDAAVNNERYRVQVENKDLMDYSRNAVTFSEQRAPGAFAYNTMIVPRKLTDGKKYVVVRVRGVGRYFGYGTPGVFETYQRAMEGDLPPIYAAYMTTNPMFGVLDDEKSGSILKYEDARVKTSEDLATLRQKIVDGLNSTIKKEIEGDDFKPAYGNNNFNIVEVMGTAYQKGYYGNMPADLSEKIKVAIDSLVYINNLGKKGVVVKRSVMGNSATEQKASAGWGGLYGEQGLGMYQLWRAGQISDGFLDQKVDLGGGEGRTRREQWVEAFKESLDYGCTYNGRRFITNQTMEAAYSAYGAALALYALDDARYRNVPRLGLRFLREAVGLDFWTGVPKDYSFDGTIQDEDGFPDYELGDSRSTDSQVNFWGIDFKVMTEKGNGREAGWDCVNCYGNMGPRVIDMYLATLGDPFIGRSAGGNGDEEILSKAVANEKTQAWFTYPWVDAEGYKQIVGEGVTCWRNRYDPGEPYYNNLVVAAISGDEDLLGHVWQSYKEGRLGIMEDMKSNLFNYYSRSYWLPECIDKLQAYGESHGGGTQALMPSVPQKPDYVQGDEQVGIVAVKHGSEYLFVNFYSESSLGSCGRVHVVNQHEVRDINFIPDVMEYVASGTTETISDEYWNGNHKITYPDRPEMADGGSVYEVPSYDDVPGHYNSMRTMCRFYQQQLGAYVVAQNTTSDETYALRVADGLEGRKAVNVATGEEVVLSGDIQIAPLTSVAFYLTDYVEDASREILSEAQTDTEELKTRVEELIPFARHASTRLSEETRNGYYSRDAFMPFFKELTLANYVAHAGVSDREEVDSVRTVLEDAYTAFAGTYYTYDACTVPGGCDYRKKVAQDGALQIKSGSSLVNAMNQAWVLIPVQAEEAGDYTVTIQARGHVYDEKEPSLNVDLFTDEQYWNGEMPLDTANTRQVAYAMSGFSEYKWYVHLPAGETRLLKLTFLANTSGYTVDLGKTTFTLSSWYDRLQQKIESADSLYRAYAVSELVTDEQRKELEIAIDVAGQVKEDAPDTTVRSAYEDLVAAMERFTMGIATWKYPSADIQFRINNTSQTGDGASFEVRNSSAENTDNGFLGAIKFDVSKLRGMEIVSATLSVVTMESGCKVAVHPFSTDWGETGGTTDSYAAKQEYIDEALAADALWTFSAALGGGRKMFEWIPSRDNVYTVENWRVRGDVTGYLKQVLDEGYPEASFLFAPADDGSIRTTVICKDVNETTFGTSTTDDYYLDGDKIGQPTGQKVTRWARIVQLLHQDGSEISDLIPTLTVEYDDLDGVKQVEIKAETEWSDLVDVYDLEGRKIRAGVPFRNALDRLPYGIYVINGKKYQNHR